MSNATWTANTAAPVAPTSLPTQDTDASVDELLRQDAALLELKEQRRAFLVEQHMANAKSFRDQLRLEDAQAELLAALTLDSDNLSVKRSLDEINALLGNDYSAEAITVSDMLSHEMQLRSQEMRAEAGELLRDGKLLLAFPVFEARMYSG